MIKGTLNNIESEHIKYKVNDLMFAEVKLDTFKYVRLNKVTINHNDYINNRIFC